jgi:phosphate transport system permease protein
MSRIKLIFKKCVVIQEQTLKEFLITRTSLLKRRYRTARAFKFLSIFFVLLCLLILVVFIVSIARSAIIPLYAIDITYTQDLKSFVKQNLENKNIYNYFPVSYKYTIAELDHNNRSEQIIAKYEFKKFFITGEIHDKDLYSDYQKFKDYIVANNLFQKHINWHFLTKGDAVQPENAGIKVSLIGSLFVLVVFVLITIPAGILVGLYIAEFLPQGKLRNILQINIQNLASIPSIIYGIIVLNILINGFGLTRSSALVGGIALSFLILPMIVMITYNAASMVPQGYKDASLALGLSSVQTVFIVTLPMAMPRIITGILLAIARAAGETAPLIIVGMAFFASNVPNSLVSDAVTTLPLQIFLWTSNPKEAFIEYASSAILIFIIFLTIINFIIHRFRAKLETK